MCFEILGFDILIDNQLKPWLLEVNHTPSFSTDSDLDFQIKTTLVADTLKLVNVRKKGSKPKKLIDIEIYQNKHLGGFKKIFPCENQVVYEDYMNDAKRIWNLWAQGKKKNIILSGRKKEDLQGMLIKQIPKPRPFSAIINSQKNLPFKGKQNESAKYIESRKIIDIVPKHTEFVRRATLIESRNKSSNHENINSSRNVKDSSISRIIEDEKSNENNGNDQSLLNKQIVNKDSNTIFNHRSNTIIRPRSAYYNNAGRQYEEAKCENNKDLKLVHEFLKPKNVYLTKNIFPNVQTYLADDVFNDKHISRVNKQPSLKNLSQNDETQHPTLNPPKPYIKPVYILNKQLLNNFLNKHLKK